MHGLATGRDDALLEANDLLLPCLVLGVAGGDFDFNVVGIDEAAEATDDFNLAQPWPCR